MGVIGASLCSGIGAPEVAAPWVDWRLASETAAFPRAVLQQRFGYRLPADHNQGEPLLWGDMTEVTPELLRSRGVPLPDILVAGTPCQAFSVAGARKGLADARGNLTLAFVETCHAIVAARPDGRLAVLWENVPGVLSDRGNAFGCFLGGLVGALDAVVPSAKPHSGKHNEHWRWKPAGRYEIVDDEGETTGQFEEVAAHHRLTWPSEGMVEGPWARAAWAVLDAQWFGVAQRRRRVFVVVDFGGAVDPAAVLLEPDRLRGDHPPRRETGEGPAGTLSARTGGGGGLGTDFDCDDGLTASTGDVSHCLNAGGMGRQDYETETLVSHALRGEGFDGSEDGTGRGTPLVPVAFAIQERAVSENPDAGPDGAGFRQDDAAYTLEARPVTQAVAFELRGREGGAMPEGPHDTANIRAASGGSSRSYIAQPWAVRRLMPVETARLQGFPATSETIMVELCEDAKSQLNALAGIGCTTGQGDAKSASGARLHRSVRTAGKSFRTAPAGLANPAALHVRIDLELRQVLLLNAERLIWSASIAEESSVSPLPMRVEDFAHLAVHMMQTAAKLTPTGRAASRIVETSSTTLRSGVRYLRLSGPGTEEAAASAAHIIRNGWKPSMSTTSRNTLNTQSDELILKTLSFCVLNAIGSSIPLKTLGECISSLMIEVITPHTAITYRGKPAADGPQYQAHGNSMAVPVVRWIMNRMRVSMLDAREGRQ